MATEELSRRGHVGLVLERGPLWVRSVVPGSSAAAAGVRSGDRLTHIEQNPVEDLIEVRRLLRGLRAGAPLLLTVERGEQVLELHSAVMPFPLEQHEGARVVLDAVRVGEHLLRVYAVVPEGAGPHPVVQYLPGAHWASEEYPLTPEHPVPALAGRLARAGLAMVRVERSGLGDSQGPPCTRVDFEGELAGHAAGLEWLGRVSWADARRVFLFAHSLGAMVAPLIAERLPVRGIVNFGASAIPISVALAGAIERHAARQPEPETALRWAEQVSELIRLVVQGGLEPRHVFAERPDLQQIAPSHLAGDQAYHRVASFYHQLERRDLVRAWRDFHHPTLVLHGERDWISTEADSRELSRLVGGSAQFAELPGVDHQLSDAGPGQAPVLAEAVWSVLSSWLEHQLGEGSTTSSQRP